MHKAAELAETFIRVIKATEDMVRENPYADALIDALMSSNFGDKRRYSVVPAAPRDPELMRTILYTANDAIVRRLWQQHRTVYDIDADLWEELKNVEPDAAIPAGLMQQLPHSDPLVVLPDQEPIPISATEQMLIRGFFVVGSSASPVPGQVVLCSTHDDAALGDLNLLIAADVVDKQGRPVLIGGRVQDMVWTRITLTLRDGDTTIGDLVARIAPRFDPHPDVGPRQHAEAALNGIVSATTAVLVYLCATNAELHPLPSSAARGQTGQGAARKPVKVIRVGYRIGATLRAWRRSEERGAGSGGGRVRPHVRRAHPHTYRVGPGRQQTVVKFLFPIPVNMHGDADVTTVVPVK